MYTILLIDDEPTILETLSTTICWQQFGVDTLLTASDGCQALDIMSHQKVDLLITDIKMPNMDGLTLLKEVRVSHPDTHCILLTAYSEFEYARTAMQLGVENYLLKPLKKEELEETIEKALDNIYTSRKISRQLFRNNILLRWANGSITGEELSERGSLLDVNLYLPEYLVVCISKKQSSVSLSTYCKLCAEQLSSTCEIHQFKDDHNRYVFIIGGSHILPDQLISCFTTEAAKMDLKPFIALSVGNMVQNADSLPESYQTACRLLESMDSGAPGMLILTEDHNSEQETDRLIQELNNIFQQKEEDALSLHFQTLTDKLFHMSENDSTQSVLSLLTQSLCRLFSQEFPNHPEAQEQLHNRIRLLPALQNRDTFMANVNDLLKYSHILFCYYIEQLSPIIQAAIRYIHKHYAEGISIQEFCVKNKMSSAYLGYLFKKETGFFFNSYLTQYRICCSIHLLLDTDLKINDIALKVGFSYPSYYISCFKKQTGLSPIKYRVRQL